jgi:hypothetical protein
MSQTALTYVGGRALRNNPKDQSASIKDQSASIKETSRHAGRKFSMGRLFVVRRNPVCCIWSDGFGRAMSHEIGHLERRDCFESQDHQGRNNLAVAPNVMSNIARQRNFVSVSQFELA